MMSQRFKNPDTVQPMPGDIAVVILNAAGEVSEYKILANVDQKPDRVYRERPVGTYMQWGYEFSFIKSTTKTTFTIGDSKADQSPIDWAQAREGGHDFLQVPAYKWNFTKQVFEKIQPADMYASDHNISGIAPEQSSGLDNNTWVFVNKAHWIATEYVFVDYSEKYSN